MNRTLRAVIFAAFAAAFAISAFMLLRTRAAAEREEGKFVSLASEVSAARAAAPAGYAPAAPATAFPERGSDEAPKESGAAALPQYAALCAANHDFGGWVKIDGTIMDYPVMFTPEEPEKYLHLDFSGEASSLGTPFFGAGSSLMPRSGNLIVYGHNMKSGKMFASLLRYRDESYFRAHSVIRFGTLYDEGGYGIIAAFPTDLDSAKKLRCYDFIDARDKADFDAYIAGIKAASLYDTGVTAEYGSELLTLSTCAYHAADGRFVLVARKLPDQRAR